MNCFDNIIGIKRTCESIEPSSGLYLNDLSGISIKDADAAISEEYASGVRMIKTKIDLATKLIISHLRAGTTKFLAKSTIENGQVGIFTDKNIITSESGKLKGVQFRLKNYPYFSLSISSISFYAHESKDIEIYVYDLVTGQKLDTFEITTIAGQVVNLVVNKKYGSASKQIELFICTDSDIAHNQANLSRGHCGGCSSTYSNSYSNISYFECDSSAEVITANLIGGQSTGGLSFSYSLECSTDAFICSMANTMAMPVLYKSAALILEEMSYSKRQNSIITVYKENTEELQAKYDTEFEASLGAIMNNMRMPNDVCFLCNSSIRTVAIAP